MSENKDSFWSVLGLGIAIGVCFLGVIVSIMSDPCDHVYEINHLRKELSKCNAAVKKAERLMNDSNIIIVGNE